jgi:hypothetical protein
VIVHIRHSMVTLELVGSSSKLLEGVARDWPQVTSDEEKSGLSTNPNRRGWICGSGKRGSMHSSA